MKNRFIALPALLALCALLASCTAAPKVETPSEPAQPPALNAGRWELVCEEYRPVGYDLCDAIYTPKYEGKTQEQWEHYSISIGMIDGNFITWAVGGTLSPDGRWLAYVSNKDCLAIDNTAGMSVFLLDMYSQTEQVLLSGAGNLGRRPLFWLDNETLLCSSTQYGTGDASPEELFLCSVDGSSKPVVLEDNTEPTPFAANGRIMAYITGAEQKELRVVRVEEDGSVTELGQKELDGYPVNGGGISADGMLLVFPLRPSWEKGEREVCVWNLETGETVMLKNPTPAVGADPAAVWVQWDGEYPEVDFRIENAPDSNGHNELWRYVFET